MKVVALIRTLERLQNFFGAAATLEVRDEGTLTVVVDTKAIGWVCLTTGSYFSFEDDPSFPSTPET